MTEKENKDLKKEQDLDELMKNATQKVEDNFEPNKNGNKKNKKIIIYSTLTAALLLSAIGAGAYVFDDQEEFVNKTEQKKTVVSKEKNVGEDDIQVKLDYPVIIKDWAVEEYDPSKEKEVKEEEKIKEISKKLSEVDLAFQWLPSSAKSKYTYNKKGSNLTIDDEYTNDTEKKYLPNGEDNPKYSYALREDYQKAFATITERLLNPLYGGWLEAQDPIGEKAKTQEQFEVLSSAFDVDWWNKNVKKNNYSKLPIYADWDNNNFGGLKLSERSGGINGTFFGKIKETKAKKVKARTVGFMKNSELPFVKVELPVEFVAYDINEKKLKKTGTLIFTLVPNEDTNNPTMRVVAKDARLIIN